MLGVGTSAPIVLGILCIVLQVLGLSCVGCWDIGPYVLGMLHIVYHVLVYCILGTAMLNHRY